jgi:hypothetical protein
MSAFSSRGHIVQHARRLLAKEPFRGRFELVLDLTGVGRPVADLFRSDGLKVTITGGNDELVDERGVHHVARLTLVSQVQTLLHDGRLQIQKELADAPVLRAELEDFRAVVTDSGRWTFGARSGAHDELVLTLALAVWRANRRKLFVHPDVLRRSAISRRPQSYPS